MAEGKWEAQHGDTQESYQINSLSPHLFTGSSGGEFGGVGLTAAGSVSPLMVKVWTVQPIQRDQHLQSQCEKAGKHHNHLFQPF